ncbi:uncharacterized protein [Palaemon carinicauda]|uniref:uncharacterized protein n=1 Tax=Palaemon carinicauda TaxID=392227 RepID=UPI0035B67388
MAAAGFVFYLSFFKNHLLLLGGTLLISLCASSSAQQTGYDCYEEQLGVWTGNIPFKSGMNVSIDSGPESWGNIALYFQENGTINGKITLKRSGHKLKITGIGFNLTADVPSDFLRHSKKLTLGFQMTNQAMQMTLWNDIDSFTSAFDGIASMNIDSIRIYSKKNLENFLKTVFSVCNLDRTVKTKNEPGDQTNESSTGVITCPPCPTTMTCPTSEPSPAPEESVCPPCLPKSHLATFPHTTSTIFPCPTPVEKTCPPCPTTSCPYVPSPPTTTACPKSKPCPTPTPCPSVTTSNQEKQDEGQAPRNLILNKTFNHEKDMQKSIFLEDWDELIMYGIAAGCAALLLVSVALAIALGRAIKKVHGPSDSQNFPPQKSMETERNNLNNLSGTLGSKNFPDQMNPHCTGNQSPNAETDEDDFDSDHEEWDNTEPIYGNINHFDNTSNCV